MFAHEIILEKSGPLARVWLAAHWDKKLKKKDIFETKLIESVDNIINPKVNPSILLQAHPSFKDETCSENIRPFAPRSREDLQQKNWLFVH